MGRKEGRKREREGGSEKGREESYPLEPVIPSFLPYLGSLTCPHYLTLRSNKD